MASYTSQQYKEEIERLEKQSSFRKMIIPVVFTLLFVAAAAVLVSVLLMPTLRIYGTSMEPTLTEGDCVLVKKGQDVKIRDIIAFNYNDSILIKRVIALPGDYVDIDQKGNVYVNNELFYEPYLEEKQLGECDIILPYLVPEGRVFVMGDSRLDSIDSRSSAVGCIPYDMIIGKVVYRLWPLKHLGKV